MGGKIHRWVAEHGPVLSVLDEDSITARDEIALRATCLGDKLDPLHSLKFGYHGDPNSGAHAIHVTMMLSGSVSGSLYQHPTRQVFCRGLLGPNRSHLLEDAGRWTCAQHQNRWDPSDVLQHRFHGEPVGNQRLCPRVRRSEVQLS